MAEDNDDLFGSEEQGTEQQQSDESSLDLSTEVSSSGVITVHSGEVVHLDNVSFQDLPEAYQYNKVVPGRVKGCVEITNPHNPFNIIRRKVRR